MALVRRHRFPLVNSLLVSTGRYLSSQIVLEPLRTVRRAEYGALLCCSTVVAILL